MNNPNANNGECSTMTGGILSNIDLRRQIVPTEHIEQYMSLFKERDWKEIKNGMIRRFATQGYIPERRGFGNE